MREYIVTLPNKKVTWVKAKSILDAKKELKRFGIIPPYSIKRAPESK